MSLVEKLGRMKSSSEAKPKVGSPTAVVSGRVKGTEERGMVRPQETGSGMVPTGNPDI